MTVATDSYEDGIDAVTFDFMVVSHWDEEKVDLIVALNTNVFNILHNDEVINDSGNPVVIKHLEEEEY